MDYKEMCFNWVEDRKEEADLDEWWQIDPGTEERISGPYRTEAALDDVLWALALEQAHETYLPLP